MIIIQFEILLTRNFMMLERFLADKWLSQASGFSKTDFKTEMFFLLYF